MVNFATFLGTPDAPFWEWANQAWRTNSPDEAWIRHRPATPDSHFGLPSTDSLGNPVTKTVFIVIPACLTRFRSPTIYPLR